jgi:hypothetical protein
MTISLYISKSNIVSEPERKTKVPGVSEKGMTLLTVKAKMQVFFSFAVCPGNQIMINRKCLQLVPNLEENPNQIYDSTQADLIPTFTAALGLCTMHSLQIADLTKEEFDIFTLYLKIWGHSMGHGSIWLGKAEDAPENECTSILVLE